MVSKYHGSNDDSTRISCVSHWWISANSLRLQIHLGYRCGFGWHVTGPRDQIGYWAVNIVTDVPEDIPLIGSLLVELLRGSASVGQSTLTLFTVYNTFGLPLLNCFIYVDALSNDT